MASLKDLCCSLPVDPLPPPRERDNSVPHAPVRTVNLTADERRVCLFFPVVEICQDKKILRRSLW